MRLLSIVPYYDMGYLLSYLWEPCWFAKLFGYKTQQIRYLGEGTVWHSYPDGTRCGPELESWLTDQMVEWEIKEMKGHG